VTTIYVKTISQPDRECIFLLLFKLFAPATKKKLAK